MTNTPITTDTDDLDFSFVLASSVHDMKNSLGMLLTTLATMSEQYPAQDQQQAQLFSTLEYEAARINSELIQLLALYRMDEHRLAIEIDEHYVCDVIEEQIARNHTLLEARGIRLQLNCDPGARWYFDSEMLGGVLNNLLVNCARYSREQLLIDVREQAGYLVISVADDGAGYPPSMLAQQDDSANVMSFSSGSTRLGLVFARKVLAMHKSKVGKGFLCLRNGGELGGGIVELHLP